MQCVSSVRFLTGKPLKGKKPSQLQWEHKEFMYYDLCVENLKRKVTNLD